MGIKTYNPYTPSRRNMTGSDFSEITKTVPEKSLCVAMPKHSGRNNQGKITVRHHGGGAKKKMCIRDRGHIDHTPHSRRRLYHRHLCKPEVTRLR